jgi:hypothetical protein
VSSEEGQAKTGRLFGNNYKNAMHICEHKGKSVTTS